MGTAYNSLGTVVTNGQRERKTDVTNEELEYLSSVTPGLSAADKAVVLDSALKIDTLDMTAWKIGGVAVTATASNLNTAASTVIQVGDFGAVGDGSTDDTTSIQAALDTMEAGDALEFEGGKVYMVSSLKLPNLLESPGYRRSGFFARGGTATIRSNTTNVYLIAHDNWIDDTIFAGSPFHFEHISFDANEKSDYAVVHYMHNSNYISCDFRNALIANVKFTTLAADGTTKSNSNMSDNKWIDCRFVAGAATTDACFITTGDASMRPADGMIQDCTFDGGAQAPYCVDLLTGGGWKVTGNHMFNSTTFDFRMRKIGVPGAISNNIFEKGALFENVDDLLSAIIGPGNSYWLDAQVNFTADSSLETVLFIGEQFSSAAKLTHNSNQANKTLYSIGNVYQASAPYDEVESNSLIVRVNDIVAGLFEGLLDVTTVAGDALVIPVTHRVVSKTTAGDAEALSLADGVPHQELQITLVTDGGGDGTLTPTTTSGFATIVFADPGDTANLKFVSAAVGWIITGLAGVAGPPAITV